MCAFDVFVDMCVGQQFRLTIMRIVIIGIWSVLDKMMVKEKIFHPQFLFQCAEHNAQAPHKGWGGYIWQNFQPESR